MNQDLVSHTANRRGFESTSTQDDFEIPRAKLFHGLPTEYEEYPNAKPGDILNNITKEKLPEVFLPIMRTISWVRFNPRDQKDPNFNSNYAPGALLWTSSDPTDQRVLVEGSFGPNGTPPLATKFISFLSYFPGLNMPVLVSFSKTSLKEGKKLNTLLNFNTGDMWESKFTLSSKLTKTDAYAFYVFEVASAGKSNPEEQLACENIYSSFHKKKIEPDANYE